MGSAYQHKIRYDKLNIFFIYVHFFNNFENTKRIIFKIHYREHTRTRIVLKKSSYTVFAHCPLCVIVWKRESKRELPRVMLRVSYTNSRITKKTSLTFLSFLTWFFLLLSCVCCVPHIFVCVHLFRVGNTAFCVPPIYIYTIILLKMIVVTSTIYIKKWSVYSIFYKKLLIHMHWYTFFLFMRTILRYIRSIFVRV